MPHALWFIVVAALGLSLGRPAFAEAPGWLHSRRTTEEGQQGEVPMREGRILRLDGSVVIAELWGTSISYQGQSAVLTMGRDITERKALEQKLQSSERLASIGTLAAGVAHEINNPLSFVISNLTFIADEAKEIIAAAKQGKIDGIDAKWAEAEQALGDAWQGAKRVQRIVRDLKAFSRPADDADGAVEQRPVVEFTIEIRHRAEVTVDLAEVPEVFGNSHRLGQVLLNLLMNAAQAIPDGAVTQNRITLRSGLQPDGRVFLEVEDTGCGIPPEKRGPGRFDGPPAAP